MAIIDPIRKLLAVADGEIGYSRWTDPEPGTKYARDLQPIFWPKDKWLLVNGINFCDIWVTYVFKTAFGEDFVSDGGLPAGASYNTDYRASKGGRVSKPPKPGDVVVFDWNFKTLSTNHVGILEKVLKSGNYQTIEGNTSPGASGSQSSGGGVYRRVRRPDQVRYVLRPNWSMALGGSLSEKKPETKKPETKKPWEASATIQSLSKDDVKDIQTQLTKLGYDLGSYGVDGSYGEATFIAVKAFQTSKKLTADGVAGPKTREVLSQANVKPTPKPASKWKTPIKIEKLDVDGRFGHDTVLAMQLLLWSRGHYKGELDGKAGHKFWAALATYVGGVNTKGEIRYQSHRAEDLGSGITQGWSYTGPGSKGDPTIKRLQKWLKVGQDGILFEDTIKALQRKLNTHGIGM